MLIFTWVYHSTAHDVDCYERKKEQRGTKLLLDKDGYTKTSSGVCISVQLVDLRTNYVTTRDLRRRAFSQSVHASCFHSFSVKHMLLYTSFTTETVGMKSLVCLFKSGLL